jgi:hypothetical protein
MSRAPIISVSGTCSRAGKTALAETLLRALPAGEVTAVKFTITDDVFERCPRGTTCIVCDIDVPFRIVDDAATLGEPGTDTARLGDAGARRVWWAIARQSAAEAAWAALERRLPREGVTVLEGSAIVPHVAPELRLFVAHPFLSPARWKATTAALVTTSDAVIVNRPRNESRPPSPAVLAALAPARVRVADVSAPLTIWAPDLGERLHALLPCPLSRGSETTR